MELEDMGVRLAKLRMAKGISAREMSFSLGQSENYINKIENNKAFPSMSMFFQICKYLGISPQDFFDDSNNNPKYLNELVMDLKILDEKVLLHIKGIVKEMNGGK